VEHRHDWSATVAHFVANHRRSLVLLFVALALASGALLAWRARFASDVLDLLPRHFDSVRVFKQFDREFSQARELTFAVLDESGEVDFDAFIEHFADKLRAEPWVERVMEKSPLESAAGVRDVQRLAVPLLLNLPAGDLRQAIGAFEPAAIDARITKLRAALESGSPKAEFDLDFDPLGVIGPALKPLAGSFSVEQTRPLASPDGTLRVVLALTRQTDLGARACQETMRRVDDFQQRVLASWDGAKPQVFATGRTAYVGELSRVMRSDVQSTALGSLLFVGAMFWLGFRRVRPLFAMMLTLLLSALVAVALGALIFGELNMITIGLCAILFGLGEDFGMMLYGIYQAERSAGHDHEAAIAVALRQHGSGIIFGALTTAAAFLCLMLSGSSGFMQLGVLVAIGIVAAGALMMSVFFVLLTSQHRERKSRLTKAASARLVQYVWSRPVAWTLGGGMVFAALAVFGYGPFGKIEFAANPKSLEPRHSRAGDALRLIQRKMPVAGEPVLAVIEAKDAEAFHAAWNQAQAQWSKLIADGRLKSANSPAAFAMSPQQQSANAGTLHEVNFDGARAALRAAVEREGLSAAALAPAFGLLDELAKAGAEGAPAVDWRSALAPDSPWWFVVDRFLGHTPQLGAAYLVPAQPVVTFADRERLAREIAVPGVDVHFSGWRYMLAELIPWSKTKLAQLSAAMLGLNLVLLCFLFRRPSSIAIIFAGLALGVGALLATLKATGIALNLFNVLAFPLVLGVGVDYAIYLVLAMREADPRRELMTIFKPVLLSGVTTVAGFGSLITAQNPALRGLGLVCAIGVGWCLVATFFFILPVIVWRDRR
jgi:uncharacterized protein